jgi:hypothetical protein
MACPIKKKQKYFQIFVINSNYVKNIKVGFRENECGKWSGDLT